METENAPTDIDIPNIESVKEIMQNIGSSIKKEGLDNSESLDSTEYQHDNSHDVAEQSSTTAGKDSKIASMLAGHLADFKKPVDQNDSLESDNLNEKLHTIDYFASQGIKIDLNELPKDKLTTKLLTFTDWLKVMRKSKQANLNTPKNLELENAVAETAQTSVESREVLTETMAEVLVKQGQIEKAIQLFIKLSFSNPEKTAYFASKIQQLKGI
jgi:hypothetical protein